MDFRGRLLAGVLPPNAEKRNHSEINGDYSTSVNAAHGLREMQVTGTAQVCSPADLASVRVTVGGGSKDKVNEATNSASRRLEYILQAVRWCFMLVFAATHWTDVLSRRQSMLVSRRVKLTMLRSFPPAGTNYEAFTDGGINRWQELILF